jgi:peroxiredoxin
MSDLRRLLNQHHPFVLALALSAVAVALVVLFNLGKSLTGLDQAEEVSSSRQQQRVSTIRNVEELPPFALQDTAGATRSLSEWEGRVILLNFWATWCPPCKYEIPDFIELQAEYGEAGFQIVGIGIDEAERIRSYHDEMGINYPVLIATDPEMMSDWGNRAQVLPYSVVIDRDGEIRYIHRGQLDRSQFEREILPLITPP